jgi:two-component system invasion response regulator UvrY
MIHIIIADDHPVFREGLKKILNKEVDLEVSNEVETGEILLSALSEKDYDLIILDVGLPGRSGIDILSDIRKLNNKIPVLVYSMHPEERYALRAFKAGANAYLSKEENPEILLEAIHKISSGKKYITASIAEQMANTLDNSSDKSPHEKLSTREFEVMLKISMGQSIKEIAEHLSISMNTVNTYRARVFEKMGFHNNIELAHYVIENKLIE